MSRLARDWPAYILLAGVLWFVIYVFITSRKQEKKEKENIKKRDK